MWFEIMNIRSRNGFKKDDGRRNGQRKQKLSFKK